MPNMPATRSACSAFAPETLRERKIRSGISGVPAVASRAMNAASSASDTTPNPSAPVEPQPSSAAGWTIVYTASISAPVISTAPGMSAPWARPMPLSRPISRTAMIAVAMPIGMLTKKIQCQLIDSVRTPPASRPIEPPAEATKP